jgi:D-lactate dehydrogenase (cytochrome)
VQRAAEDADRYFPLSLGSEGSCQIGGNLSTNAGGVHVLRYGMMRELVLGLEVALPDGRLLSSLTRLRKDNTGYDIKALFLGAEGSLGIITAASLKLFPRIRATATTFAAVRDPRAAIELLARLRAASADRVSSFELIPRLAVELTVRHIQGVRDPLQASHSWYVLCELSSSRAHDALETMLSECLEQALTDGLLADAVLARNERERAALWTLRESIPEAQRRDGASLKHDISVPVAAIAEFIERAGNWVREHVPDGRLVAYGHAGDGNLHFNINQAPDADRSAFLARGDTVKRAIHDLVRDFDGSISAEHGIGRLKVAELERYAPAVELDLMRAVKHAFDPNGIMNPGKVLR